MLHSLAYVRAIDEPLVVQEAKDLRSFSLTERPRLWPWSSRRARRRRALAMVPIVGGSCTPQRRAGRPLANDGCQFGDALIDHHVGSPPLGSALPVASCSSSAEFSLDVESGLLSELQQLPFVVLADLADGNLTFVEWAARNPVRLKWQNWQAAKEWGSGE